MGCACELQRPGSKGEIADVLRPGSEMVAAGYTMSVCPPYRFRPRPLGTNACARTHLHRYGSSANLVLSTGNGVNGYTLDAALGEFILTHPDVRLPPCLHTQRPTSLT